MFALSLGVRRINEVLPSIAYAVLSGLNASTVGIVALAAVQLAEKAIKDKLSRILVIGGACAGLCYNSLWYFPTIVVIGGLITVLWDCYLRQKVGKLRAKWRQRKHRDEQGEAERNGADTSEPAPIPLEPQATITESEAMKRHNGLRSNEGERPASITASNHTSPRDDGQRSQGEEITTAPDFVSHKVPVKVGLLIILAFFCENPSCCYSLNVTNVHASISPRYPNSSLSAR
jgi:hypothetical protein